MMWNSLIILIVILIIKLKAEQVKFIFHKTWKIRDRTGIGFSSIITYLIPIIFSFILDKDDAVSFLAAFALASVVGNVSITIQQKTSLARGSVSRRSVFLLVVLTLMTSYFLLVSAARFDILSYLSISLTQTFSLVLFVGSRFLHTSSLLYDRLNLNGDTDLFVLQLQRITLMAIMGLLTYSVFDSIPLLFLMLTAVNVWFSIGVLIKK